MNNNEERSLPGHLQDASKRKLLWKLRVLQENRNGRRYLVDFLLVMYGMSSLLAEIGILVEIPLLVESAPEGQRLPAYIAVLVSLSSMISVFYVVFKKFITQYCSDYSVISGCLVVQIIAMAVLALFYDVRCMVNGKIHSIVLLLTLFVCSIVASSSSLIFMPYLRNYKAGYLPSFFLGESLGGLVPGMIALLQGVGSDSVCKENSSNSTEPDLPNISDPNFPPGIHFLVIFILAVCCAAAFWLLEYLRDKNFFEKDNNPHRYNQVPLTEEFVGAHKPSNNDSDIELHERNETDSPSERAKTNRTRIYICMMVGLTYCVGPGIVYGTQAFSCLPYGIAAYHLVITLMQFAGPAAFVFGYCLPPLGVRGVTWVFAVVILLCSYIIWLALSSPSPLWHDEIRGAVLLVTVWVVAYAMIGYIKLSIAAIGRRDLGKDGLYHVGLSGRVGIVSGAFISFVLINYTSIFTPYKACP
ncbi:riboflavin transporter 2-like [Athalia rosae]|uniref:riboflavin transporter 2-like n=1 Tax=Athalia rosae TaxID=37344 RepID=UPI00203357F7|nr:riboflavin transporter 2-like [Athalia rosae]